MGEAARKLGWVAWTFVTIVGCSQPDGAGETTGSVQAALGPEVVSISYPASLSTRDVFMSATERFQGDDRVLLGALGPITNIASLGSAGLELGSGADARANAYSAGSMFLRSNSTVRGFARSAFSIVTQPPVTVSGGTQPNSATPVATSSWEVEWPPTVAAGIFLGPEQPPAAQPPKAIAPGAYSSLNLHSRARVLLNTGRYYFDTFNTEPDAKVYVNTSAGPIYLYTRSQFRYHGRILQQAGPASQVLLTHVGTQSVDLQVGFTGTIVAPKAQIDLRRPTVGQHRGAFFGKRIQVYSDSFVEHVPFEGSLDGRPTQDFPDTPADGPINMVPSSSGSGIPVTDYEVCPAGLDLVTEGDGIERDTTLQYAFNASSACGYRECADDNSNPGSPTETALNEIPDDTEVCAGTMPKLVCGVDPDTVDMSANGLCVDDSSCVSTGRVCALICSNAECTTSERRCAKQAATCRGLPEEAACRDVRQCADVDYTGDPEPVEGQSIGKRPPNSLEQQPQAPQDLVQLPKSTLPPTYPRGDVCKATGGIPAALPEQLEPRETNSGNTKWGLFAHPEVTFKATMNPLAIGGESTLDFAAGASFTAGAYVWGQEIEALEARASATIEECQFGFQRKLELFGVPVDIGPAGGTTVNAECASLMEARGALARKAKFYLFKAEEIKKYVQQAGFTQELCNTTYIQTEFAITKTVGCPAGTSTCVDVDAAHQFCSTIPGRRAAAQVWIDAYSNAIATFKGNQLGLDAAKEALSDLVPSSLELVDIHHHFSFAPPTIIIPVGPVQVTIEVEIAGGWGVAGNLDLVLERNPNAQVGADAKIVPDLDLTALAFAGVGIGPVSFGIGGQLLLLDVEAPLVTGVRFTQTPSDDNRPKTFPGAPTAFPTTRYRWNANWTMGSRVKLSALDGQIDLQARVNLLFFKKTFRKKIAEWDGFTKTYDFLGANVPLASVPGLNFGDFGEEVAYVQPDWLDDNLVAPATPVATPVPDVLTEDCGGDPK